MRVEEHHEPGLLRLAATEKALVNRPDWAPVLSMRRADTLLVALDLEQADFISSLFLEACVELGRELAASGQELVLLHLSAHQEGLLELVEGPLRLSVLKDDDQLARRLAEITSRPGRQGQEEGVSRNEKLMLWG